MTKDVRLWPARDDIPMSTFPWRRMRTVSYSSAPFVCCLLFVILAVLVPSGDGNAVSYCSDTARLAGRYLVPFYEYHLDVARGCVSSEAGDAVVHVLRVNTTSRNVLLTVTETGESRRIVLVLHSPTKIRWRLAFVNGDEENLDSEASPIESRTVALSPGSTVFTSNAEVETTGALSGEKSDDDLLNWVRKEFGAVSTYASIEEANRISILLPRGSLPSTCQLNSPDVLPGALVFDTITAFAVTKQTATGCFHPEMAGNERTDVHVVNLESAGSAGAAYISMAPKNGGSSLPMERNLTLILRSAQPVKWYLQSRGLKGNLTVIVDRLADVQNLSLAPGQRLVVRYKEKFLPGDFESLWRAVLADTDGVTPVSYSRMARANIISLTVNEKKRKLQKTKLPLTPTSSSGEVFKRRSDGNPRGMNEASIYYTPPADLAEKTVLISGDVIDKAIDAQADKSSIAAMIRVLKSVMSKTCSQSWPGTIVAIDVSAASHYLVDGMTLNDPSCKATKNQTHWILRTPSTSCGSLNQFSGRNPMFSNNVILSFTPSSRYNRRLSPIKIPFNCRIKPGLGGGAAEDGDYDEYDSYDSSGSGGRGSAMGGQSLLGNIEEMYKMSVSKGDNVLILESRDESADVAFGDRLTVRTDFETRSFLNLALNKCWISEHPDPTERPGAGEMLLVVNGCPATAAGGEENVVVVGSATDKPKFSFTVTERLARLRRMYVFCVIGLCSPLESLAGGNVNMCVDAQQHCTSSDPSVSATGHRSPVAQQLSRRGPLFVHRHLDSYPDEDFEESARYNSGLGGASTPVSTVLYGDFGTDVTNSRPGLIPSHVVMVGVPAEIAVAIALASFVVGAGLTGLLCCVHHRKTVPKTVRLLSRRGETTAANAAAPAAEGSELQSMLNHTVAVDKGGVIEVEGGGGGTPAGGLHLHEQNC